jgi:hypothetical protein
MKKKNIERIFQKCSRLELHNLPNFKDNTKCKWCGKTVGELKNDNMKKDLRRPEEKDWDNKYDEKWNKIKIKEGEEKHEKRRN